jgi:D-alanine-D-alanine ligase-like ATP-grasp enzyme
VAVKISLPANVVGNGASTIETLIAVKNREREIRAVPGHHPIVIDAGLRATLQAARLSLAFVPAAGRRVLLRRVSNGAVGADSIECAEAIHASYAGQVEAACAAIPGIRICAIDMVILDRQAPATPRNHWILELNSSPGLLPYHYPWQGRPQDIGGAILRHLGDEQGAG